MKKNIKSALLSAYAMMALSESNNDPHTSIISNPYSNLPAINYKSGQTWHRKTPLTKKQKKIRIKNKQAKQIRKQNRK